MLKAPARAYTQQNKRASTDIPSTFNWEDCPQRSSSTAASLLTKTTQWRFCGKWSNSRSRERVPYASHREISLAPSIIILSSPRRFNSGLSTGPQLPGRVRRRFMNIWNFARPRLDYVIIVTLLSPVNTRWNSITNTLNSTSWYDTFSPCILTFL